MSLETREPQVAGLRPVAATRAVKGRVYGTEFNPCHTSRATNPRANRGLRPIRQLLTRAY